MVSQGNFSTVKETTKELQLLCKLLYNSSETRYVQGTTREKGEKFCVISWKAARDKHKYL